MIDLFMKGFRTGNSKGQPGDFSAKGVPVMQAWEYELYKAVNYHKSGKFQEAIAVYESLEASGVQHEVLYSNLGAAYRASGRLVDACRVLEQATSKHPENVAASINLAEASRSLGRLEVALNVIDRCLDRNEGDLRALRVKAAILDHLGRYAECLAVCDQCFALGERSIELRCIRSLAIVETGSKTTGKEELIALSRTTDIKPQDVVRIARSLTILGELTEARWLVDQILEKYPSHIGALLHKAQLQKEPLHRNELEVIEKAVTRVPEGTEKAGVLFTLGKQYEKAELYSKAFRTWEQASALKMANWLERPLEQNWLHGEKALRAEAKLQKRGTEYQPKDYGDGQGRFFIIGLPRSGSTLLETILSRVEGSRDLGESRAFGEAKKEVFTAWRSNMNLAGNVSLFDALDANGMNKMFEDMAEAYAVHTSTRINSEEPEGNTLFTTDKMLFNYQNIPLIARAFPGCRIIHVHRNPLDNMLSMFKENFREGNEFTYCIESMVEVYHHHMLIMKDAKRLFKGSVVESHYDSLVMDPESYLEALFAKLGLAWDASLLSSGRQRNLIRTASVIQARAGIHAGSVGKWKNYEKEFASAKARLEEYGYSID